MSVGQEFWIVAGPGDDKDGYMSALSSVQGFRSRGAEVWNFNVPSGEKSMSFGSFDNLIRLTDDLQKADSQLDTIVHRFERQYVEIDPGAVFQVESQRQKKGVEDYLKTWSWDESKYPKSRALPDNLQLLMQAVGKLDEETRIKTGQFNDLKTQLALHAKKDGPLANRELIDVFTPSAVSMKGTHLDDFVYSEHMTTVVVILPRGAEATFLKGYERFAENVVPGSAKKFNLDDKDGNSIWRVVMFRSAAEHFKKACREIKLLPRDFEYDAEAYNQLNTKRAQLEEALKRQHDLVRNLFQAAWSDAMVAWVHVKAMRVFVEGVLRFGTPPKIAAYTICPDPSKTAVARKALADILGASAASMDHAAEGDDGEEFFPYVSFSLTPLNIPR